MLHKSISNLRFKLMQSLSSVKQQFSILDIKNDHLVYVQDSDNVLPFMKQVQTDEGDQGIVLKLQGKSTAVIGFYNKMNKTSNINIKTIKQRGLQTSPLNFNHVYDIEGTQVAKVKDVSKNVKLISEPQYEGKKIRVPTISPILSSSYNIFYGDFTTLYGSLGSGRSKNALSMLNFFVHQSQNMGFYLNASTSAKNECLKAASMPNTLSFGRFLESKPLTSVGVYMLTLKCLDIVKEYKEKGHNVMLVIDNLNQILANEWSVLHSLNLPISPVSVLNELYVMSEFGKSKGSLTTIVTNSLQEEQINTVQQSTIYSNNPKHLKTISQQIEHPLKFASNYYYNSNPNVNAIRQFVNKLLKEKKQTQLLRKLRLDKEEPWEYYYILDSEWWVPALKLYKPVSIEERDLFLWFITVNIENDFCAYWTIPCVEAYNKYLQYLGGSQDYRKGIDAQQFDFFMELAKMKGYLSVFKKDYLQ